MLLKSVLSACVSVEDSDVRPLGYSFLSSAVVLCAYYYLQPLGDTLALQMGLKYAPIVSVSQLILFMAASPAYSILSSSVPVSALLPTIYRSLLLLLLVFGLLFFLFPKLECLTCFKRASGAGAGEWWAC